MGEWKLYLQAAKRIGVANLAYNLLWVTPGVVWHRETLRHVTTNPKRDGSVGCTRCGRTWKFRYER